MAKYHLKQDGTPAACEASVKACPRGGDDEHYDSVEDARAAFEASMASRAVAAPTRRVKLSLMDRLKGRTEEEVAQEQFDHEFHMAAAKIKTSFHEDNPVAKVYDAANHYGLRKEEAMALVNHAAGLKRKIHAIEQAATSLVKENPRAFAENVFYAPDLMDERGGMYRRPPAILRAGEDTAVHEKLRPMAEKLVHERWARQSELEAVAEEAKMLTAQITKEGNMGTDARGLLSQRTQELYAQALGEDSSIPAPEQVEDRRAWISSREQAHEELEARNVI